MIVHRLFLVAVHTGCDLHTEGLSHTSIRDNTGFAQKSFFNTDVLCKKFFNSAILGPALRGDTLGPLPRPSAISLYDGWMFRAFTELAEEEKASRGRLTYCFLSGPCPGLSERSEASSFPTSGPGWWSGCRRITRACSSKGDGSSRANLPSVAKPAPVRKLWGLAVWASLMMPRPSS